MTPQTKKILLIGGSLLAIAAGIAIYSHRKNKPENIDTGEGESKLDDVLAGGIKDANGKKIYPIIDGLKFYNLEGKEAGKSIKNKALGTIAIVIQDSKGTKMVYFLGENGIKYKMPSVGLNVAI